MTNQKRTKKFVFGNEKFGGSYTPGEFEIKFPEDMSREDFEKMFKQRMDFLHKRGNEFAEEIFDHKSKKENLKPLSIRVKPHTKEFFKKHSILSPRDVLELYENYNNGSEAFINSLIEEEKQLEKELVEVQEKLHNAKLFREKLTDMEPIDILSDDDKLAKLQNDYKDSEIVQFGNETSPEKAISDIINHIRMYNTLEVNVCRQNYIEITVYTEAIPSIFYFKNEYSKDDFEEIVSNIEEFCKKEEISFKIEN